MNGGSRAGNFHPLRRWEWGVRRRAPIRRVRMPHLLPYCEAQGPGDWGFLADPSAALMAGRNLKKYISRENYNILIRKIAKIIELFNNLSSHSQQQLFGTEFCSKSKLGMGAFSKLLSNTRSFLLGEHTDWTRGVILIGGLEMYELEAPDWLKYLTFRGIRETLLEDFDSSWINYNRFWIRIMKKKCFYKLKSKSYLNYHWKHFNWLWIFLTIKKVYLWKHTTGWSFKVKMMATNI